MHIQIENVDCLKGLRDLKGYGEQVDVIVTSPPYNLDTKYSLYKDKRPDYMEWASEWAALIKDVMKDDASFFLNVGSSPSNPWLPYELALEMRKHFELQNTIHWIKSITVRTPKGEALSVGHFKPINSPRFITDVHEFIFHFTKTGKVPINRLAVGVPYADKSNVTRWGHTDGKDVRCRGNTWYVPYATINSRENQRPHPASFPSELVEMCINLHDPQGEFTVLDPFTGIGNSGVAARRCGASMFVGFDIDEHYTQEAWRRVQDGAQL